MTTTFSKIVPVTKVYHAIRDIYINTGSKYSDVADLSVIRGRRLLADGMDVNTILDAISSAAVVDKYKELIAPRTMRPERALALAKLDALEKLLAKV